MVEDLTLLKTSWRHYLKLILFPWFFNLLCAVIFQFIAVVLFNC